MTILLETAQHTGNAAAVWIGITAFGLLASLLGITVLFGTARPHTK